MEFAYHDLIGTVGVILIVGAYFLLTFRRISSSDLSYSIFNAVGAALIIISLVFEFNLPAFLMEFFWLLISIAGIAMSLRARRRVTDH